MKKRDLITITVIILLMVRLILIYNADSAAKYATNVNGSSTAYVAKWIIKVNDIDLTHEEKTMSNLVTLVPDNRDNVAAGKLAPGYGGYFDVVIDPTGTEVSFKYTLTIDTSKLPTDIVLTGYNLGTDGTKNDAEEITANTITREIRLPENSAFTNEHIETVRVYWMWNDIRTNDAVHTSAATSGNEFSVGVNINVTQIIE